MPIIGIREFKNRASEIVKKVRNDKDFYIITCHGRPQAMIIPLEEQEVEDILSRNLPLLKGGKTRRR